MSRLLPVSRSHRAAKRAQNKSVRILTAVDQDNAEWLREISDRRPVTFVKGKLRAGRRYVACIGTWEPS